MFCNAFCIQIFLNGCLNGLEWVVLAGGLPNYWWQRTLMESSTQQAS